MRSPSARRSARSSTPATGSSTRARSRPADRRGALRANSATKACWRSSAIPPTLSATADQPERRRGRRELARLIAEAPQRVAFTTFASNVGAHPGGRARRAARRPRCGRRRPRHAPRHRRRARARLSRRPAAVPRPGSYEHLPRNKVVALMTGSQGEPRAALARVAEDDQRNVDAGARRHASIFSSRTIPGNETRGERHHQRAGRCRRRGDHRPRRAGAHVRPSAARRARGSSTTG